MAHHAVALKPRSGQSASKKSTHLKLVDRQFEVRLKARMADFSAHLLVMKGLGKSTIDNYRRTVSFALRALGTISPGIAQVQRRIAWAHGQNYSYFHKVGIIRSLEAYMGFIGSPIRFGRPRKPKRIIKDILTEAETAVIIAASKNVREKTIMALLAYSGVRNQELCNLRVRDVDFGNNLVSIIEGKGAKSRVVPIHGDCVSLLLQYLGKYPRQADDYLFTASRSGLQLSTWAIRRTVKRVAGRTEYKKRVHPHIFRHSLASNMVARGANILDIKDLLGHSFVETTLIYVTSRAKHVQAAYRLFAPSYL